MKSERELHCEELSTSKETPCRDPSVLYFEETYGESICLELCVVWK